MAEEAGNGLRKNLANGIHCNVRSKGNLSELRALLRGGAQYATEIEAALGKADAVVVLWSQSSVGSAWVRNEAAAMGVRVRTGRFRAAKEGPNSIGAADMDGGDGVRLLPLIILDNSQKYRFSHKIRHKNC